MRYVSVCSGIEAATVAWHHLGWKPAWFSEIEPFPSAVLAHHYPEVKNLGDMTKFEEWPDEPIDLLVGGTPCQSFSVAGLRKGLTDPRGNLMLTFLAIAQRQRPRWIVWENVPGVLSSNGGRDFGTFLGALGELGYGWAYRVLDAQWFGVAQRRRRVFVVGCLGDQASAAKVLFESESVQRNPPPSREKRQSVAASIESGIASGSDPDLMSTLCAKDNEKWGCNQWVNEGKAVIQRIALAENTIGRQPENGGNGDGFTDGGPMYTLNATGVHGVAQPIGFESSWWDGTQVAATLTKQNAGGNQRMPDKDNFNAVVTGAITARFGGNAMGAPEVDAGLYIPVAQPVAFHHNAQASQLPTDARDTSISDSLTVSQQAAVAQPVATFAKTHKPMSSTDAEGWSPVDAAPTVTHWPRDRSDAGTDVAVVYERHDQDARVKEVSVAPTLHSKSDNTCDLPMVQAAMQVRRLTPVECERLQGFPDGYTNIPWRGKPESPDGPRYKALGNSMAVPVMRWIGERIAKVDANWNRSSRDERR